MYEIYIDYVDQRQVSSNLLAPALSIVHAYKALPGEDVLSVLPE